MITLHLNLNKLCSLIDKAGGSYSATIDGEMYKVRIEFPNRYATTILLHKQGETKLLIPLKNYNKFVDVLPSISQYANDYTFSESLPAAADVYSTKEEFAKEKLQMNTKEIDKEEKEEKEAKAEKIAMIAPPYTPLVPNEQPAKVDPGVHYRFTYQGLKLDPARIGTIYGITHPMQFQALKKLLCTGNRGHKSLLQDIADIECCLQRWKEMLQEDETSEN